MKNKKTPQFFIILILVIISVALSASAFLLLYKTGIVTTEKSKLSDWVSALISTFAFVSGAVAVYLAYQSMRLAQKAEEGNLYLRMMERYASSEMVAALRTLSTFHHTPSSDKSSFKDKLKKWNTDRLLGEQEAMKIENARHLVKYFYRDLMQLVQAKYFSEKLAKFICNTGGRHIFMNVILPMDDIINDFKFDGEYDPFTKIYGELEAPKPKKE